MFRKRPKTAQQKAQRAQMRIFARLACCAYLAYYVIVPLIRDVPDSDSMNPTVRIVVIAAFIAVTAVIVVFTAVELVRSVKAGLFKATAYSDDEEFINEETEEHDDEDDDEDDDGDDEHEDEYDGDDESGDDEYDDDDDDDEYDDDDDDDDEYNDDN